MIVKKQWKKIYIIEKIEIVKKQIVGKNVNCGKIIQTVEIIDLGINIQTK